MSINAKTFGVKLSAEQVWALDREAARRGLSRNALIRLPADEIIREESNGAPTT